MINLNKINLISMGRNELLEITRQELEEYKQARIYNQVSNNILRIKNLEALDKRLGYFAVGDNEVQEVRTEVKDLLNEDVYKKTNPKGRLLSDYEVKQKQYSDYMNACNKLHRY